ncbi:TetR family transcriptional regulator [Photorhabdus asymbiotica]|nr:TetR family transcriptional regulator [Photorhabdus asymbiotica]
MSKQSQDIRQHILEIVQKIIGCKGLAAVGLNEIWKVAEVPKGLFYYYLASRGIFGTAMLEDYFTYFLSQRWTTSWRVKSGLRRKT